MSAVLLALCIFGVSRLGQGDGYEGYYYAEEGSEEGADAAYMYVDASGDAYESAYYYYYEDGSKGKAKGDAAASAQEVEVEQESEPDYTQGFSVRKKNKRFKLDMQNIPQYAAQIELSSKFRCLPADAEFVVPDPEGLLNETLPDLTDGVKRSAKEVQEIKRKTRALAELRAAIQFKKKPQGLECESLVCASCKVNVEEFAQSIVKEIENPQKQSLDAVLMEFCASPDMQRKYNDIVIWLCEDAFLNVNRQSYTELLLSHFETAAEVTGKKGAYDWAGLNSLPKIVEAQEKVCVSTGMCPASKFKFDRAAKTELQEQWSDECFVCQQFSIVMEEIVLMMRNHNDRRIGDAMRGACQRLNMPKEYLDMCNALTAKYTEDLVWLFESYPDKVRRQVVSELSFADGLCQGLQVCAKYARESDKKQQEEEPAVFY